MEQFLSAAEVAKWVGVHYRTIENWAASEHLERKDGKYGLLSAFKYKIERLERELNELKHNPLAELKQQKLAAEVDKEQAIARIKNLEADFKAGKLVDAEEVLLTWQNYIASCRAKFLAMPTKLALELSGMDEVGAIAQRLTEAIDEGLRDLSEVR